MRSTWTLARHVGGVQCCGMAEAHCLQKAGETAHIADQPLGLHLLAHVQRRIGPERVVRVVRVHDQRERSQRQRLIEIEAVAQLCRQERMHGGQHGPAGQEIDAGPPELASAGAGEDEDQTLVELDELMDHRQQLRHALHLVDHDRSPGRIRGDRRSQPLGCRAVESRVLGIVQVYPKRVGIPSPEPRRLARPPRTEQEVACGRWPIEAGEHWTEPHPDALSAKCPSRCRYDAQNGNPRHRSTPWTDSSPACGPVEPQRTDGRRDLTPAGPRR